MSKTLLVVSSWKRGNGSGGLCVYSLDDEGNLQRLSETDPDVVFNYSYIDTERSLLYALEETDKLPGQRAGGGGQIYVYKIDPENGLLTLLGRTPTWCPNPSFMSIDPERRFAVVSNHSSKAVATKIRKNDNGEYELEIVNDDSVVELFGLNDDGTIGKLLDVVYHYGSGPEARQASPRPHCAVISPDGSLYAVCDKGNDTFRLYKIDRENNKLILPGGFYACPTASLPRYCVFHPEKPYVFHNNENCYDFCSYSYDSTGKLELIGRSRVIPDDLTCDKPKQEQQGLAINPNGKYIYDIVRGPDIVSVMKVDEETGNTCLIQTEPIHDEWPRGNCVTADGRFLIVCGFGSGKIFVYRLDEEGLIKKPCSVTEQACAAYVSSWIIEG